MNIRNCSKISNMIDATQINCIPILQDQKICLNPRLVSALRNMLHVYGKHLSGACQTPKPGPLLVTCPRPRSQYARGYSPYLEAISSTCEPWLLGITYRGLQWPGSGQGRVLGCCEHGNESAGSIKTEGKSLVHWGTINLKGLCSMESVPQCHVTFKPISPYTSAVVHPDNRNQSPLSSQTLSNTIHSSLQPHPFAK